MSATGNESVADIRVEETALLEEMGTPTESKIVSLATEHRRTSNSGGTV